MNDHPWTKPFYGVTHIQLAGLWATVSDYGSFADVWIGEPYGIRTIARATFFRGEDPDPSLPDQRDGKPYLNFWAQGESYTDNAKAWSEQQIKGMRGILS